MRIYSPKIEQLYLKCPGRRCLDSVLFPDAGGPTKTTTSSCSFPSFASRVGEFPRDNEAFAAEEAVLQSERGSNPNSARDLHFYRILAAAAPSPSRIRKCGQVQFFTSLVTSSRNFSFLSHRRSSFHFHCSCPPFSIIFSPFSPSFVFFSTSKHIKHPHFISKRSCPHFFLGSSRKPSS